MTQSITDSVNGTTMLPDETKAETGNTPSLIGFLQVLLRRVWLIVLVTTFLTGSTLGFTWVQTPTYEASTKIIIGQKSRANSTFNLEGDVAGLQGLTATMTQAVTTRPIAQATVKQLDSPTVSAEELLENLSAQEDPGTMFIDVSYTDSDPKRAQLIANTVSQVFSEQVSKVSINANAVTATVWEPAVLPETPVSPDPLRNAIVALILGILLGVGSAFVVEYLVGSRNLPEEKARGSSARTTDDTRELQRLGEYEKGKQ
jgi:capsular polysaccharide biosynthesis protein